jgi:hypothetical protein
MRSEVVAGVAAVVVASVVSGASAGVVGAAMPHGVATTEIVDPWGDDAHRRWGGVVGESRADRVAGFGGSEAPRERGTAGRPPSSPAARRPASSAVASLGDPSAPRSRIVSPGAVALLVAAGLVAASPPRR